MGANGEANNEELQALKQEVVIMRDRLEHHPEVKRFAGVPFLNFPVRHRQIGASHECCQDFIMVSRHFHEYKSEQQS